MVMANSKSPSVLSADCAAAMWDIEKSTESSTKNLELIRINLIDRNEKKGLSIRVSAGEAKA